MVMSEQKRKPGRPKKPRSRNYITKPALQQRRARVAAWDTYLRMKKPGALPDVLEAQVNIVRRDIDDTIGTLQSILSRLLLC